MAKPKSAKGPRSKGASDLEAQTDPRAPLDGGKLLAAARPVLKLLREDLLARAKASPAVTAALTARHDAEKAARRTADGFLVWQEHFVDQVAAAWFLSCVFARTLEDRSLVSTPRLAGPGAADSQHLFFEIAPSLTERDYLLTIFRELSRFPAVRDLFDARHNPVWLLTPSAEAAKALLQLFRAPAADAPAFRFGQVDTRFLGDLYQDLNADVKERFALLQTPRFVESFILDRTLERAIEKFGLDETTLIDPTCGSGHFLLGAFDRLFDHRLRKSPGLDVREAARRALDAVFGADINPYAVAIARFRLTLAFLEKAGYQRLADAPALPLHLVVADSLLHNPQAEQSSFAEIEGQTAKAWSGDAFALEDETAARDVLHRRFAAVVGNPPYITVKDAVMRERYRDMYVSAAGKYSLAAPFAERFFQLAKEGGAVGMITANSFMKREFGKKLIEQYLPTVNVDLIINTSGAYIPGHGTPTVLLFGTNAPPEGAEVPAVLAKRGEPSTPDDPEHGFVWRSVADHWQDRAFENDYVSTARLTRESLAKHPWSLGGGGASELKELLEERAARRLGDIATSVGISCVTGEDEVYLLPRDAATRLNVGKTVPLVTGEYVRDWSLQEAGACVFPYDEAMRVASPAAATSELRYLWPFRAVLGKRKRFGTPMLERGLTWYELQELYADKLRTPLTITFAFVATHNHFVLDRGGKVFKQSAPIIKLPETATEDDHLALLAYLNSSTACFWMKQVCHNKNNAISSLTPDPARAAHEFAATALLGLPIPPLRSDRLVPLARALTELAQDRANLASGEHVLARDATTGEELRAAVARGWSEYDDLTERAAFIQEEIDWEIYRAFALDSRAPVDGIAMGRCPLGSRPFEILTGYDPGLSLQSTGLEPSVRPRPRLSEWDERYATTETPALQLIESREYKRMWRDTEQNIEFARFRAEQAVEWCRRQLAQILEDAAMRSGAPERVAVDLAGVPGVRAIAEYLGKEARDLAAEELRTGSVPFVAGHRLLPDGMDKRLLWEQAWDLQRREDAGENVGTIPVPPKYDPTDFRDPNYYRLRGKLDVPKERFISYPGCESDEDGEPVYGWAGWNHLQQAQALAALYQKRKTEEAWGKDRLTPMLAGLLELLPWLKQWHNEPNDEYGGERLGDFFEAFIDGECRGLGLTHDDLRGWRPPEKKKATKAKKPKRAVLDGGDEPS